MSRELFSDLQTTNPPEILRVDKFAFRFTTTRLNMNHVKLWDPALVTSLKEAVSHYEDKSLVILKMLLPSVG